MSNSEQWVVAEVQGRVGCITLNRPKALNALSLSMVRELAGALLAWRDDPAVLAVAIRGTGKEGPFGAFCAGGDIRFFHQAAHAGNPELEDFFTEEYALNHLIHTYPKPYIAFMDGICMGGGMGISQGASLRVVTERSKLAMPETHIGLFPDVGGGYFLSRCAGRLGEYLALTGRILAGQESMAAGLADGFIESGRLAGVWASLATTPFENGDAVERWVASHLTTQAPAPTWPPVGPPRATTCAGSRPSKRPTSRRCSSSARSGWSTATPGPTGPRRTARPRPRSRSSSIR